MDNSLVRKSLTILKKEGPGSLLEKSWRRLVRPFEPLISVLIGAKRQLSEEAEKAYTPDRAVDFAMNKLGKIIRPQQVKSEITALAKIVEELNPGIVVEVGSARGGTLFIFSRLAAKNATIATIDIPEGYPEKSYPKWREALFERFASRTQTIHLLWKDSQTPATVAALTKILEGRKIDFLFIDGDHSYAGVKKDYELYSPLVRKGGIIAFHDIAVHPPATGSEVHLFWAEVKQGKRFKELIENPGQGWAGIGVVWV